MESAANVIAEINKVRHDPTSYVAHLEAIKGQYDGNYWKRPGKDILKTKEGVVAVDDAIKALKE